MKTSSPNLGSCGSTLPSRKFLVLHFTFRSVMRLSSFFFKPVTSVSRLLFFLPRGCAGGFSRTLCWKVRLLSTVLALLLVTRRGTASPRVCSGALCPAPFVHVSMPLRMPRRLDDEASFESCAFPRVGYLCSPLHLSTLHQ